MKANTDQLKMPAPEPGTSAESKPSAPEAKPGSKPALNALPIGEVEVDQSALTGESLPAARKSGEAVFSGSILRRGEIEALVYATGENTYFGKTAKLVQEAHTVSHLQQAALKIDNYLIILAVALVAVIVAVAIYRGNEILTTLQFALVLTVAAIPVAMPTVLSVTMAVGANLLARKKTIVSRLVAVLGRLKDEKVLTLIKSHIFSRSIRCRSAQRPPSKARTAQSGTSCPG